MHKTLALLALLAASAAPSPDRDDLDTVEFLISSGFLEDLELTDSDIEGALYEYQRFMGLPPTGREDAITLDTMSKMWSSLDSEALSTRWSHTNITYAVRSDVSRDERAAITRGVQLWAQSGIFTFRETYDTRTADMVFEFTRDLENYDLASGYKSANGRYVLQLNRNRGPWETSNFWYTDRLYVSKYAAYLVGILLGLPGNDPDPNSVMSRRIFDNAKPLTWYELKFLRDLYPTTTTTTTTTTRSSERIDVRRPFVKDPIDETPPVTRRSTFVDRPAGIPDRRLSRKFPRPLSPTPTPPLVREIYATLRGDLFVFQGDSFWRVWHDSDREESQRSITSKLLDFPSDVDLTRLSAVFQREDGRIGALVGDRYFLFLGKQLVYGYPKNLPELSGAIVDVKYSKLMLFILTDRNVAYKLFEPTLGIRETVVAVTSR